MYGLKVYITPEDIIARLSPRDKKRFNQCVFTDVIKEGDGSITIDCIVFDDPDPYVRDRHRQKYFGDGLLTVDTSIEPIKCCVSESDHNWEMSLSSEPEYRCTKCGKVKYE